MVASEFRRISRPVTSRPGISIQVVESPPQFISSPSGILLKELNLLHETKRKEELLSETIKQKQIYITNLNDSIKNLQGRLSRLSTEGQNKINTLNATVAELNDNIFELNAQKVALSHIKESIAADISRMKGRLKTLVSDLEVRERRPTFMEKLLAAFRVRRLPDIVVNIGSEETSGAGSVLPEAELEPSETVPHSGTSESCTICMDSDCTHAFIPCGHKCVCEDCADVLSAQTNNPSSGRCPMCRVATTGTLRIY